MTSFDSWLAALREAGKGPVALTARRGEQFSYTFALPGNWTGSTLRGQVRAATDASGAALVDFACAVPVLADGFTVFTIGLAAGAGVNSTGILPADETGSGSIALPYDLLLTPSGGFEELLWGGPLTVLGAITQ